MKGKTKTDSKLSFNRGCFFFLCPYKSRTHVRYDSIEYYLSVQLIPLRLRLLVFAVIPDELLKFSKWLTVVSSFFLLFVSLLVDEVDATEV